MTVPPFPNATHAAAPPSAGVLSVGRPGSSAGDSGWRPAAALGSLSVALRPRKKTGSNQYGDFEAAECDAIVMFDSDGNPTVYEDAIIFQRFIAASLLRAEHPVVPFIVGQSEARGRNNPAWIVDHEALQDGHMSFVEGWIAENARLAQTGRVEVRSTVPRHIPDNNSSSSSSSDEVRVGEPF